MDTTSLHQGVPVQVLRCAPPLPPISASPEQEHLTLLRQLARLQCRVSEMAYANEARCAHLEMQLMRARAALVIANTQTLWGLGFSSLHRSHLCARESARTPPKTRALEQAGQLMHKENVHAATSEVICQSGCVSHAHHWLEDGQCRLSGQPCERVVGQESMAGRAPHE